MRKIQFVIPLLALLFTWVFFPSVGFSQNVSGNGTTSEPKKGTLAEKDMKVVTYDFSKEETKEETKEVPCAPAVNNPGTYDAEKQMKEFGFPEFINTGNPKLDQEKYSKAKKAWIDANPERYNALQKQGYLSPVSNKN